MPGKGLSMTVKDVAVRLNDFYRSYDQHAYDDAGGSLEEVERVLREDPAAIIADLLSILEDMMD